MDCTFYVVKPKTPINCMVTAQLICTFVIAYAKIRFSHDEAHYEPCCGKACLQGLRQVLSKTYLSAGPQRLAGVLKF